ncbi:MAG: HlyD family efflux transporter periplasmic adaptor subunit [Planctomycetaceae bacterium]|nr:HlyD family efflux transporter periplasmic adaptor subunit [Planctomycetaceae bacterium]
MASPSPTSAGASPSPSRADWLAEVTELTGALGGAIWQVNGANSPLVLAHQCQLGNQRLDEAQSQWAGHEALVRQVANDDQPRSVEARFELGAQVRPLRLHLVPLTNDADRTGELRSVLELFVEAQHPTTLDAVQRIVALSLTPATALPSASVGTALSAQGVAELLASVAQADSVTVAQIVAVNELCRLLKADRVSLCTGHRDAPSLEVISGLDGFDPRSAAARAIVDQVWKTMSVEHGAITRVSTVSGGCAVVCRPDVETAFLIEWGTESPAAAALTTQELQPLMSGIGMTLQLLRAREELHRSPWSRVWAAQMRSQLARRFLIPGVISLAIIALCVIPADLIVTATGELRPVRRRDLYAPFPAVVEQVPVLHGQSVTEGALLLQLSSDELDFETQKLRGELQTTQQQITDVQTLQSDQSGGAIRGSDIGSAAALAAREEELKVRQRALQDQLTLLDQQRKQLRLLSPLTGTVLTWNVEQLLTGRRVDPSQRLLTVADLAAEWELEVQVPQSDLAPLRNINTASETVVACFISPAGEQRMEVTLDDWATELRMDPALGPVLPVRGEVQVGLLAPETRPGTQVPVELHCGRTAVGYVWFRPAIEQLCAWWQLRF